MLEYILLSNGAAAHDVDPNMGGPSMEVCARATRQTPRFSCGRPSTMHLLPSRRISFNGATSTLWFRILMRAI